jgi:hypothetical protein
MNLLLLIVMLIIASGPITFAGFGLELMENVNRFIDWAAVVLPGSRAAS